MCSSIWKCLWPVSYTQLDVYKRQTHEDKIASYIKYKIDKMGKEIIMFNVHNKLYDVQN